jgi:methionyl-tRNA formyltransferase
MQKLTTVALVARDAGVATLEQSLLCNPSIDLRCVATHRFLPKAESPEHRERPELAAIEAACRARGVPVVTADSRPLAGDLEFIQKLGQIDLICVVSWRFILSATALSYPRLGVINLHRGALPKYAGAEPVRRMIEEGCLDAVITAHLMVEEVDAGPVLGSVHLPMQWDGATPPAVHAETVKRRLLPLYPKLLDLAIASVAACSDSK